MTSIKLFMITYFIFILISLLTWHNSNINNIIPQFISLSFDLNATINFDSTMLNSLNILMKKYFNEPSLITKLVGDIPNNKNLTNYDFKEKNIYKISEKNFLEKKINQNNFVNDNKYLIIPNENKTFMNIFEFSKKFIENEESINLNLYSIPIDNFLIDYKYQYDLNKSIFNFCWNIYDKNEKIIKYTISNDKKYLLILYKIIKNGNKIKYKLRYFYNITCLNKNYDDIILDGNTKINSLSVREDFIIYSRDLDYYDFNYIIKINNNWKKFNYRKINRKEEFIHHINDIQFLKKEILCKIYTTNKNNEIFINIDILKFNKNFTNIEKIINIYQFKIPQISYEKNDLYYLKKNKKYLKKIYKSISVSNIDSNSIIIKLEMFNDLYYIEYKNDEIINKFKLCENIENIKSLNSDSNFNYLIIENKENILNLLKINDNLEQSKQILLNSVPKRLKNKKFLSFYFDNFNDKLILLILLEGGILLSVNFKFDNQNFTLFNKSFISFKGFNVQNLFILVNFLILGGLILDDNINNIYNFLNGNNNENENLNEANNNNNNIINNHENEQIYNNDEQNNQTNNNIFEDFLEYYPSL